MCTTIAVEEAQDAALITKSRPPSHRANGHPVVVGCDHGVARVSGVVLSADDARHAAQVAAGVPGATGIDNKLIWMDLFIRGGYGLPLPVLIRPVLVA